MLLFCMLVVKYLSPGFPKYSCFQKTTCNQLTIVLYMKNVMTELTIERMTDAAGEFHINYSFAQTLLATHPEGILRVYVVFTRMSCGTCQCR